MTVSTQKTLKYFAVLCLSCPKGPYFKLVQSQLLTTVLTHSKLA